MKIGIVGAGTLGSTVAYALLGKTWCTRLVLVDRDPVRAQAQLLDLQGTSSFAQVTSGTYQDLQDAEVVVFAAGLGQHPDHELSELLEDNEALLQNTISQALQVVPDAVFLVATQPVDVMTTLVARMVPTEKQAQVIGLGTALDTFRLRALIAEHAGVDARDVQAEVIGEAGRSAVVVWSQARIAGLPLEAYFADQQMPWNNAIRNELADEVRRASVNILQGKSAVSYGVADAIAQVVEAVALEQNRVLTVSGLDARWPVAVSLPRVLGKKGIQRNLQVRLSMAESTLLNASVESLLEVTKRLQPASNA
ncbi:lactate/malate family dehydrogenase [Deinococcus roseus]|uniref:L-lactate dehydrogenase n=1 Tax=Deinococcus roseus TaxID=392414 RepID=A0ABQ2CWT6_9DEIO|nr:L-lactate dehydrogenase [Deinococcus roseus]GGJ28495.1 L-lactate dehydrogenase [Deinococcus roseus]